ncbi:hypothetical protein SAMN02745129_2789 [Ferrimonas marina]|uniref:Uncharacterized protein n=1 Tax=Ferrimonas marina TaxID=299255 RepID=A0A1M5VHU3_9GAMM|nr:hypothetical protein SAMN02745129_2789 [Ferrimonas marina]
MRGFFIEYSAVMGEFDCYSSPSVPRVSARIFTQRGLARLNTEGRYGGA